MNAKRISSAWQSVRGRTVQALTQFVFLSATAFFCTGLQLAFFSGESRGADELPPGIAAMKPADGPAVEVEQGFMVPYTERIPGTDATFEMIPIPGGTFLLGSPESEAGRSEDEGPQVQVKVPPMWVAKEEVSWAEYKQFMSLYGKFKQFEAKGERVVSDDNMVDAITAPTELYEPSFTFEYGEELDQPAVTMTPYAARQYTKWMSRITGRQYRLPTEAEWEYACRGGTTTAYSWGDDAEGADEHAWFTDNTDYELVPGGQKKANPFGLFDMHGGVAELCVDRYTEDGYAALPTDRVLSPEEAVQWPEEAWPAVARGGSWEMEVDRIRSAARLASDDEEWKQEDPNYPKSPWWYTSDPARGVGFRLFRSYAEKSAEEITPYWEINTDDVQSAVRSRLSNGRGVLGLVDPELPEALKQLDR